MSKKNLPNIPIYIGDWEKDCNVLSLETEAAWLRIIFKMFTNGKQSHYKIPTNGLQNLWRCTGEKVEAIIQELLDYNICEINTDGRFVEFVSRRFKRENEIGEIRKSAVSQRKDRKKFKKEENTFYKKDTKEVQTSDIDIDNEIEIEIEKKIGGAGGKKKFITYPFGEKFRSAWEQWRDFKEAQHDFEYKSQHTEQAAIHRLVTMSDGTEDGCIAVIQQSMANGWKDFYELKKIEKNARQTNEGTSLNGDYKRELAERMARMGATATDR